MKRVQSTPIQHVVFTKKCMSDQRGGWTYIDTRVMGMLYRGGGVFPIGVYVVECFKTLKRIGVFHNMKEGESGGANYFWKSVVVFPMCGCMPKY